MWRWRLQQEQQPAPPRRSTRSAAVERELSEEAHAFAEVERAEHAAQEAQAELIRKKKLKHRKGERSDHAAALTKRLSSFYEAEGRADKKADAGVIVSKLLDKIPNPDEATAQLNQALSRQFDGRNLSTLMEVAAEQAK